MQSTDALKWILEPNACQLLCLPDPTCRIVADDFLNHLADIDSTKLAISLNSYRLEKALQAKS